ncbi:MAG: hypothetical protein M3R04_05450 [bacterium]|nr:hypothetical protein [bacterium]
MSKHSPGPWHWDGYYDCHIFDFDGDSVVLAPDVSPGNAMLISAAPELLDALKAILGDSGAIESPTTAEMRAVALIARIEGD